MKRSMAAAAVFFLITAAGFAQNVENSVVTLDGVIRDLSSALDRRLGAEGQAKIAVARFTFQDSLPPLGQYWNTQLTQELGAVSARSWTLLEGNAGADLTISGEIVEIVNTVRVYTRLVRTADRAILFSIQSDFTRDPFMAELLAPAAGERASSGGRSSAARDAYEPDSMATPLTVEIGTSSNNARSYSRTIHSSDDVDYFLLIPEQGGLLVMETSGSMDTVMELYDANDRRLTENDDGGSGSNARIRQSVEAGGRYIAQVRSYGEDTGSYGFFAYLTAEERDPYEPDSMDNPLAVEIGTSGDSARIYNRTIHSSSDEDFFLLTPEQDGLLVVETSGSLDTFMELYDGNGKMVTENDDGGSGSNARIRQNVQAGSRYTAKVRGYDGGETGPYDFFAYLQAEIRLPPDEFEPDNDFSTAKELAVGTPQQHTFHNGGDVDYVQFTVVLGGQYTIRARGLNSDRLDTYIELFDSRHRSIDEDDDGGDGLDSRLSLRLEPGTYYLKAECLNEYPDQPYVISITEN